MIVHVLESVDVRACQRERTAVSLCAPDVDSQSVMERAMVREPGQRIGIRFALKASRCLPRLRKHDLEVTDPRLEVMLAPALGIPRRAFEVRL